MIALSRAISWLGDLHLLPWATQGDQIWLPSAPSVGSFLRTPSRQIDFDVALISDGQFVWGPNVGYFDIGAFLAARGSPLAEYAADIELWSSYSSVNPQVVLVMLELQHGWITSLPPSTSGNEIRNIIEQNAMGLAATFYEHLHTWGSRAEGPPPVAGPTIQFQDGSTAQLAEAYSSGTVAIATALAADLTPRGYQAKFAGASTTFQAIFGELFPGTDLLDTSNEIDPQAAPPDALFQLPFPLGARWVASGPHSWNGGSYPPPFSSIDFFTGGGSCSAPPNQYAVAAAYGDVFQPYGYSCWLEIAHGDSWTTSYYHMQNVYEGAPVGRDTKIGTIACETCAGGFATGPHVHFSLKYNGAYASLEGVKMSGWTVHPGTVAYNTGSFERDGVELPAYSAITNDFQTYYSNGLTSLRFYGTGTGDVDRLKIRLKDLSLGAPADVGDADFTIEWWMKVLPGENDTPFVICSAADAWRSGNIVLDRDRAGQGRDFGVSIAGGAIVFGAKGEAVGELNLCGTSDLDDGDWHHVAVQRRISDGWMWVYVDGQLEANGDGPDGDLSYPAGANPFDLCAGPCLNDEFLVVGAEKHGIDPTLRSFGGWIDEMRISNMLRYPSDFVRPSGPFTTDSNTMALYHFDDSPANTAYDTSGVEGAPSNASLRVGGDPAGPEWSGDIPFGPTPTPTLTPDPSMTPTVTETPTITETPTSTPSSSPTPTPSPTPSLSPEPTLTLTPSASPSPLPTETQAPIDTATPTLPPTPFPSVTPGGPSPTPQPADINQDGRVDVIDAQLCVNVFLGTETDPELVARADVNTDGAVNVVDVQTIVNVYLAS